MWLSFSAVGRARGRRRLLGFRIVVVLFSRWQGPGTEKIVRVQDCGGPFRLQRGARDREDWWASWMWLSLSAVGGPGDGEACQYPGLWLYLSPSFFRSHAHKNENSPPLLRLYHNDLALFRKMIIIILTITRRPMGGWL